MKTINKYIYIIAIICMVLMLISVTICCRQAELNTSLQRQITALQADNAKLNELSNISDEVIQAQSDLIDDLTADLPDSENPKNISRGGERLASLGTYTITAYCSCEKCCGKRDRPDGKVIGAAGVELIPGVSVAAPLPFGTELMIGGHEYVVQDRTAGWIVDRYDGKIIDLYMSSHEAAQEYGKQVCEVYAVNE